MNFSTAARSGASMKKIDPIIVSPSSARQRDVDAAHFLVGAVFLDELLAGFNPVRLVQDVQAKKHFTGPVIISTLL